jgi:hypothetical protein
MHQYVLRIPKGGAKQTDSEGWENQRYLLKKGGLISCCAKSGGEFSIEMASLRSDFSVKSVLVVNSGRDSLV